MKNFIKIFCDHQPYSLNKEIEQFCEDNNVEPLHTSSSYSEADYLTVVVTFRHCDEVKETSNRSHANCRRCGRQVELIGSHRGVVHSCLECGNSGWKHQYPDYVTTSSGNGGYFAMYLKWNAEIGQYEPWNTSEPFKSFDYAVIYAKEWAEGEGVEYKEA